VSEDSPSFSERYRALFNRRGSDWWSIVFGYPVARLLVVPLIPIKVITPTLLTLIGFACKLGAAWLLLSADFEMVIAGAALLQVCQVLDSMDGTLARARSEHSPLGAFLDKVTDGVGLFVLCLAVGLKALAVSGDPYALVAAAGAGGAFLMLCYMYWVAQGLAPPDDVQAHDGGAPVLSWSAIRREWLLGWTKIIRFAEADLYLWIAVLAVLGQWRYLCFGLAASQIFTMLKRAIDHGRRLARPS